MSLVGKIVKNFSAPAVINGKTIIEDFSLEQFLGERNILFFFYPSDFNNLCQQTLLDFQKNIHEFEKRKFIVVGCSTDSHYSHIEWLNREPEHGGIKGVTFPLVSDQNLTISTNFGVLAGFFGYDEHGESFFEGLPNALNAAFLIDKKGTIKATLILDLNYKLNVSTLISLIDDTIRKDKSENL